MEEGTEKKHNLIGLYVGWSGFADDRVRYHRGKTLSKLEMPRKILRAGSVYYPLVTRGKMKTAEAICFAGHPTDRGDLGGTDT